MGMMLTVRTGDGELTVLRLGETTSTEGNWKLVGGGDSSPRLIDSSNGGTLHSDFRPLPGNSLSRWRLEMPGSEGRGDTFSFSWELDTLNEDRALWIQELKNEYPTGAPIDMREENGLIGIPAGTVYEIIHGQLVTRLLTLRKGWNSVGAPLLSMNRLGDLASSRQSTGIRLPAWRWDGTGFEQSGVSHPFIPEVAYMIYCTCPVPELELTGLLPDGLIRIDPGWNFVSPTEEIGIPTNVRFRVSIWCYRTPGVYTSWARDKPLLPGKAYWIHLSDATSELLSAEQD
jgi:hypothetical protein